MIPHARETCAGVYTREPVAVVRFSSSALLSSNTTALLQTQVTLSVALSQLCVCQVGQLSTDIRDVMLIIAEDSLQEADCDMSQSSACTVSC